MDAKEVIQLMQQNRQPALNLLPELDALTAEYPWFSIAYQLKLKVLKAFDEDLFINQLPTVAIHTVNRGQLYSYIFTEKPLAKSSKDTDSIFYYQPDEVDIPVIEENEVIIDTIGTNAQETITDFFTLEKEEVPQKISKAASIQNDDLLNKFIASNPKIIPRQNSDDNNQEIQLADSTKGIASEFLAQIYVQQKLYDKALAVYKELSLQNPKKRAYFAALIKKVKEEIK